jgi:hypothetical protein
VALDGVRLGRPGTFSPWRNLASCGSPSHGPVASGSETVAGRESEAPVSVPGTFRFARLLSVASPCRFAGGSAFGRLAVALEGARLRCLGRFWPRRHLVSCRSSSQGAVALGFESLRGRESEAPVKVPVIARFAHLSAFASPCQFGSGSRAELGSVAAWLFSAPVAAGSAEAVSQTSNYVFKPTAVPPLRFNQALPRGGGLTRR